MHGDRLIKLAELLEADAQNEKGIQFCMSWWAAPSAHPMSGWDEPMVDGVIPLDCGTSACALGLAALSGAFKEFGLSYELTDAIPHRHMVPVMPTSEEAGIKMEWRGYQAAVQLFGISSSEAEFLFSPEAYKHDQPTTGSNGERYVARRIRDFVDRRTAAASA